jgi:DNA-binding LytR/AlgR family response regulator
LVKIYKYFLFFGFFLGKYYSNAQVLSPLENKIFKSDTLPFARNGYEIPPKTTLAITFIVSNVSENDTTFYLDSNEEALLRLFNNDSTSKKLIAKAGNWVPIPDRSVKNNMNAIRFRILANETKKLLIEIDNYNDLPKITKLTFLTAIEYEQKINLKSNTFYAKYWVPGFFVLMFIILLFTVIQYYILPERVLIYYFFYIFFLYIRSAAAAELVVLEDISPFVNRLGFNSMHSQVFVYISFIFYILFLREFTGFPIKRPKLDFLFKFQLGYLVLFIVFDLFFPTQKFTNPTLYQVYRGLETFGFLIGLVNVVLLVKVYDRFNKFIIIGAFALFIIAIMGQELIKRFMEKSADPELYTNALTMAWSIAYFIEISFFTMALVSRQRQLLQSIIFERQQIDAEKTENANKNTLIEEGEKANPEKLNEFEYFTLATNKGVFVYQQTEIIRLEASGNYTIFSIHQNRQTLASYTLSEFEPKLNPSTFLRVHKSHMVNLQYVTKYIKGDGGVLTLVDGSEIPVSRSRKEELLRRLNTV